MVTAPHAALKRRSRKRVTSSIGWSAARSTTTKTSTSAAATAKPPSVVTELQPCSGASMMVQTSEPRAATETTETGQVQRRHGRVARLRHEGQRHADGEDGDRHEGPEDAVPGEVLEQEAARDGPERDAHADRGTPDAEGSGALATVGEGVGDDRQRRGEDERRAHPHHEAKCDECLHAVDEGRRAAAGAEGRQAQDQRGPTTEPVAEAAHGEDEAANEVVAVDASRSRCRSSARVRAGQRLVDDRRVGLMVSAARQTVASSAGLRIMTAPGEDEGATSTAVT